MDMMRPALPLRGKYWVQEEKQKGALNKLGLLPSNRARFMPRKSLW
jgi:hypothetical protein